MGANLVSIKSNAKRKCMSRVIEGNPDTVGEFWTSGSDAGCDGNFKWCSVDRPFLKNEVQWAKAEPNVNRGDCVWTRTSSDSKELALSTDDCSAKKKFICEVTNQKQSLTRIVLIWTGNILTYFLQVRQSGDTLKEFHKGCLELLDLTPGKLE